jgi:hypothetical protein
LAEIVDHIADWDFPDGGGLSGKALPNTGPYLIAQYRVPMSRIITSVQAVPAADVPALLNCMPYPLPLPEWLSNGRVCTEHLGPGVVVVKSAKDGM